MKKSVKNKYKFLVIFLFIMFVYYNKTHYDLYKTINNNYEKRINEAYGYCNNHGYLFIKKSLLKMKKTKKIAIYNENDLAGIKWMFPSFKNLKYLDNMNSNLEIYDYLILISYSKNNLIIYEDKIFAGNVAYNLKNKFKNCYFLSKYD